MGCAASTSFAGGRDVSKDPEDYTLDPLVLKRVNIKDFDEFFDKFEAPVNTIVELNNDINGLIADILDAAADIMGGYKVTVKTEGVNSIDTVLLDLVKADGKRATAAEVEAAAGKADVSKADQELTAANLDLKKACLEASTSVNLRVEANNLAGDGLPDKIGAFNKALEAFRKALGAELKLNLVVVATKAFGASSFDVVLEKPVFETVDAVEPVIKPLTTLDIFKSAEGSNIFTAMKQLAEQQAAAAVAAQECNGVDYSVVKKRLQVKAKPKEGEEKNDDKLADLKKAVKNANAALFKLRKSCNNANASINIAAALVAVVKRLKLSIEKKAKDAGKSLTDVITINPTVSVGEDNSLDFDFGLKIDLPGVPEFPECLPGPARLVYNEIMKVKDVVKDLVAKFPELKTEVEALIEQSKETFNEPKAKFEEAQMDFAATAKAMALLARNTTTILGSVSMLTTFLSSIKRVGDEFKKAVDEIDKVKAELLA